MNFHSGGYLVAVEYDGDDTASALRERCAKWLSTDTTEIPAAFGVRVAKVGIRRRSVGVVHYGAPVRHRLDSAEAAIETIAAFLDEIDRPRPEGFVSIAARVFTRGDGAVLLDVPLSTDVDERHLRRLGIEEVPAYRPLLDLSTGNLMVRAGLHPLAGVILQTESLQTLDDARRRLWSLGYGPRLPWADFVDQLGDRIVWNPPELASALDRALS